MNVKTIRLSEPRELHIFLSDFYDDTKYDGSPEYKDYVAKGVWVTLFEGNAVTGFINFEPINNVMWNCHVMIYESFRGNNSEEWGKLAAQFMKENLGASKFLAITPYISAKKYAERVGFKHVGILSSSIKKNGKLLDQYILELGV